MACQQRNTASSAGGKANNRGSAAPGGAKCREVSQSREIIKPSITELTKEVRTNILCTVEGCGKILPNTPALNMHLVKSHRIKDGIVNPTVRKVMKGSQKLYCCPIEGCPRGPNRPFSQFSLVKQHFMKMHAEKKHKCFKCSNGYSTEWDLRRHVENCGKTYQCTCGCPYASRAALLSHIYRTGHEIPTEHRFPPVKKRKMEQMLSASQRADEPTGHNTTSKEAADAAFASEAAIQVSDAVNPNSNTSKAFQKLLLPKPKIALVSVPVMQLAHLPVLLPSMDRGALSSVLLAVDPHGSVGTLHLLPQTGAVGTQLDAKAISPTSHPNLRPVSTGVQANLDPAGLDDAGNPPLQRGRSTSATIQTDKSYLSKMPAGAGAGEGLSLCSVGESSVSSCSQTDISVSAQILLPVSVETQTWSSQLKAMSSIGAQTDRHMSQIPCSASPTPPHQTRQTQTAVVTPKTEASAQDQPIMCSDLFGGDTLSVSTQTALEVGVALESTAGMYEDSKTTGDMCFGVRTDELNSNNAADNQTKTMTLLNDLENILSDSMSGHQVLAQAASGLASEPEQPQGIDFDFEDFLNAVHIHTQTEESELAGLSGDAPLESLDIQTQTDFLLMDDVSQSRTQASDLELFDIQTQTDLNFLLSPGTHVPLSSILRHTSFSISAESSHTETQTDLPSFAAGLPAQAAPGQGEPARPSSSAETQTVTSHAEGLGHLFLTSNETQTAVDDFLSADLAWNVVSHFSSVETQTCEELCALFQHPEKPNR
eukprot:XP_003970122.1 PREDICTED: ATM interactor [Takifugu rubripes]